MLPSLTCYVTRLQVPSCQFNMSGHSVMRVKSPFLTSQVTRLHVNSTNLSCQTTRSAHPDHVFLFVAELGDYEDVELDSGFSNDLDLLPKLASTMEDKILKCYKELR